MSWAASGAQGKSLSPILGTGEAACRIGMSSYAPLPTQLCSPSHPVQEEIVEPGKEGPWKCLKCSSSLRTECLKGLRVWLDLETFEFWLLYNIPPKPANSSPDLSSLGGNLNSLGHVCAAWCHPCHVVTVI